MPVSSTATVTPSAPGPPAVVQVSQAPTASMPPGEIGSSGVAVALPGQEVPLLQDPAARRARAAPLIGPGIVGDASSRFFGRSPRRWRCSRARRRRPAGCAAAPPPPRARRSAGGSADGSRRARAVELDDELVRGEAVRRRDADRGARPAPAPASGPRAGSRRRIGRRRFILALRSRIPASSELSPNTSPPAKL